MPRKLPVFSARFFWPPRFWYLDEILLEVLPRFSARFWPPRLWDLTKILLEILSRFSASFWPLRFWDLVEISERISTGFWDLGENLGEFLAAEILRSRQDLIKNLDEILRSCRDLGENLGEFLAGKIAELEEIRERRFDYRNTDEPKSQNDWTAEWWNGRITERRKVTPNPEGQNHGTAENTPKS